MCNFRTLAKNPVPPFSARNGLRFSQARKPSATFHCTTDTAALTTSTYSNTYETAQRHNKAGPWGSQAHGVTHSRLGRRVAQSKPSPGLLGLRSAAPEKTARPVRAPTRHTENAQRTSLVSAHISCRASDDVGECAAFSVAMPGDTTLWRSPFPIGRAGGTRPALPSSVHHRALNGVWFLRHCSAEL